MNKFNFLHSTNVKFVSPIKGNSVKDYDFLKFIISIRGGHCNYSPHVPKIVSMPPPGYIFQTK
jgi:hypothetical protein